MDSQYVDAYLRKKRAAAEMAATGSMTAATAERVIAFEKQQHDSAFLQQLGACEDKIINLTKLVKLSQSLTEEKNTDLRKENHELKTRLRRQEQVTAKLAKELDSIRAQMPRAIHEAINSAVTPIVREVEDCEKQLGEARKEIELRTSATRSEIINSLTSQTDAMMNSKLVQLQETSLDRLRAAATQHQTELQNVERRFDVLETQKIEALRRVMDEKVEAATHTLKDAILAEVRTCIRAHNDSIKEDLASIVNVQDTIDRRVAQLEKQVQTLDGALAEFVEQYKEHSRAHAAKAEATASSIKELVELHEQTRTVVSNELEGTKQWATRNLHRLKKHIDVANADITALREGSVETNAQLQKLQAHAHNEHERLTALLAQKTMEAAKLTELVDKEIHSIHHIAQAHRSSVLAAGGEQDRSRGGRNSLYEDLAFGK